MTYYVLYNPSKNGYYGPPGLNDGKLWVSLIDANAFPDFEYCKRYGSLYGADIVVRKVTLTVEDVP